MVVSVSHPSAINIILISDADTCPGIRGRGQSGVG